MPGVWMDSSQAAVRVARRAQRARVDAVLVFLGVFAATMASGFGFYMVLTPDRAPSVYGAGHFDVFARLRDAPARMARADAIRRAGAADDVTGSLQHSPGQDAAHGVRLLGVSDGAALIAIGDARVQAPVGAVVPGLGRIEQITRVNGVWVVRAQRRSLTAEPEPTP